MATQDPSATAAATEGKPDIGREGTYRLIVGSLKSNPAYLLMFSIGLLGGALGLGTATYGIVRADSNSLTIGAGIWALLVLAALLTIRLVESRRFQGSDDTPRDRLLTPEWDDTAKQAFLTGGRTEQLSGRWKVHWFTGEGEHRQAYALDPMEEIDISVRDSTVSARSFDPTTRKTYWLYGRSEENDVITLLYWSQREPGIGSLSGVVLLRLDRSFAGRGEKLEGWWRGFTREDQIVSGETTWEKMG